MVMEIAIKTLEENIGIERIVTGYRILEEK
jgi:hypothetical protein